jgi:glucosamine--fructose-6-phosphate aminotransferase (isomerizing)
MCGIVGYFGKNQALPILLDGLKRLEYRGYDSSGVAILDFEIASEKAVGKIKNLEKKLQGNKFSGRLGIAHTRWATHGEPSEDNAHPHQDCSGKIWVVHNGIIENYQELKKELVNRGHNFRSETDTEVLAHLLEDFYEGDITKALQKALKLVKGT